MLKIFFLHPDVLCPLFEFTWALAWLLFIPSYGGIKFIEHHIKVLKRIIGASDIEYGFMLWRCVLAESKEQLQNRAREWQEALVRMGLKVDERKTEVTACSKYSGELVDVVDRSGTGLPVQMIGTNRVWGRWMWRECQGEGEISLE